MQQEYKELMSEAMAKPAPKVVNTGKALDNANAAGKEKEKLDPARNLDPTGSGMDEDEQSAFDMAGNAFAIKAIEVASISAVVTWIGTDEGKLDDGEGFGDRLFGLIVGIADEDKDGEITDEEAEIIQTASNIIGDYLSAHGVADEDIIALLNDFDNDVAANVHGQVTIPEDEAEHIAKSAFNDGSLLDMVSDKHYAQACDAAEADKCAAYGKGDKAFDAAYADGYSKYMSQEALDSNSVDGEAFDAVYKKMKAVRKGVVKWVKKRVAGTVRLSARMKAGIKKAGRKAQTALAKMRRAKSMKISRRRIKKTA